MKLICSDQQLINNFKDKNSLLDAVIENIEISREIDSVSVCIRLVMRHSSDYKKILLKFVNCKEYCFLYSDNYFFYNVELVKLFRTEDELFFASFDPFDELEKISDNDQDYVLARSVCAYISDI
jgi:hypothetical protein